MAPILLKGKSPVVFDWGQSVLGPLNFLIFINELPIVSNKIKIYLFSDDTNIYVESGTVSDIA